MPLIAILSAALAGVLAAILCGVTVLPALIPIVIPATSTEIAATPTMTSINMATLGGTLEAFQQRYGPAVESGLMYTATITGQRTLIILTLVTPRQSRDGQRRVVSIAAQVPGEALGVETWDAATADAIARAFLPVDARFQDTLTATDDSGVTHLIHLYTSEGLAATFAPPATAATGAFNYTCHAWPPSVSGYGQCLISLGTGAAAD